MNIRKGETAADTLDKADFKIISMIITASVCSCGLIFLPDMSAMLYRHHLQTTKVINLEDIIIYITYISSVEVLESKLIYIFLNFHCTQIY